MYLTEGDLDHLNYKSGCCSIWNGRHMKQSKRACQRVKLKWNRQAAIFKIMRKRKKNLLEHWWLEHGSTDSQNMVLYFRQRFTINIWTDMSVNVPWQHFLMHIWNEHISTYFKNQLSILTAQKSWTIKNTIYVWYRDNEVIFYNLSSWPEICPNIFKHFKEKHHTFHN